MNLQITAVYAALLGLMFLLLSARVSQFRLRGHISLGDGNNADLTQAIRAHGNFAEYVPLALILIGLTEVGGASPGWVHAFGVMLLLGRVSHAWGMAQANAVHNARKIGIVLTWLAIAVSSVYLLLMLLF
jgi:uncharacterized membrane protein YecN with MAPEG domain